MVTHAVRRRDMNDNLINTIDKKIDESRDIVIKDTIRFVNIKSVNGESISGAPFGIGPKMMLDEFSRTARADGFYVTDYGVGVLSVAMRDEPVDIGIWIHGDVVPEGEGWLFSPYDAREYKGCIIGRGSTDNKGQLAAAYNLLRIFKGLGVAMKNNIAIYLGSDEETGKRDIVGIEDNPEAKGFLNVATPPTLSLVPDASFPVGYGGFGSLIIKLRSRNMLSRFDIIAGSKENPGLASARFKNLLGLDIAPEGCELGADGYTITAYTPPRHGTKPAPTGNMITILSGALASLPTTTDEEKKTLSLLYDLSLDIYGEWHPLCDKEDKFKRLIVYPKAVEMVDGYPEMTITIRYPHGFTYDGIVDAVSRFVSGRGYEVSSSHKISDAYLNEKDTDIVRLLTKIANEVCNEEKEPYILTGGTYAHVLPNAYVFGTNSNCPPEDFPTGHGGAHAPDEAASIDRLIRMMRIYSRALLNLDELL